eukprot:PhM_4_TR5937/c0_g3_i2/m.65319
MRLPTEPMPIIRTYDFSWEIVPHWSDLSYTNSDGETHYYLKQAPSLSWNDVFANCNNMMMFSMRGYVMTMENIGENDHIWNNGYGGWMGISDRDVEGTWRYVTGPNKGALAYTNWNGVPDNAGGHQDYAYHYNGMWDDENIV